MAISWFYAVNGERKGPVSWGELLHQYKTGELPPETLVWSASLGSEWKKIADLLAPPEEKHEAPPVPPASAEVPPAPPEMPDAPSAHPGKSAAGMKSPTGVAGLACTFHTHKCRCGIPAAHAAPLRTSTVSVLAAFRNALRLTIYFLFSGIASFRTWLLLAIAVFFTVMGAQSTGDSLLMNFIPKEGEAVEQMRLVRTFELAPVLSAANTARSEISKQIAASMERSGGVPILREDADIPALLTAIDRQCRSVVRSLQSWYRENPVNRLTLFALTLLFLLILCGINSWFQARGWALVLSRFYFPQAPFPVTWNFSNPASITLSRGIFAIRAATILVISAISVFLFRQYANLPEEAPFLPERLQAAFYLLLLPWIISRFLLLLTREFLTPYILLVDAGFFSSLRFVLRSLRLWIISYLILLGIFCFAVASLQLLVLSFFGSSLLLLILLLIPASVFRAFWSLDILTSFLPESEHAHPIALVRFLQSRMHHGSADASKK